jgi:tetratricopeptide (TPR) repeat protein
MAAVVAAIVVVISALGLVGDASPCAWDALYADTVASLNHGDFEAARGLAQSAFKRWAARPDSVRHWQFRLALAESLLELNRLDEAAALLRERSSLKPFEARRLADCAYRALRLRRLEEAESLLNASEALAPQDPELIARIDLTRGTVYLRRGRYNAAEARFRHALSTLGDSRSLMGCYSLINLGYLFLTQFRYDEAVVWLERARDAARKTGFARAEALASGNLGVSYVWLGDTDRGLRLLKNAASICASLKDRVYQQSWLLRVGEAYRSQGEYDRAYQYYEQARALAQPGVDDDWLSNVLSDLTELALERGDTQRAESLNDEAMRIARRLGGSSDLVFPYLNRARIDAALNNPSAAEPEFRRAIQLSTKIGDPIMTWQGYSGLASLYRNAGRASDADQAYRSALNVIDGERSRIGQDELKLTFLSALIRFYQDYVDFLIDRGDAARAFETAASCRARVLAEKLRHGEGASEDSVARLRSVVAHSGVVLMSYWLAPRRSILWVIDSAGFRSFILPPAGEIAKRVKRWTNAILDNADPFDGEAAAGSWLFTNLVAKHYRPPAGSRVIIVPDGSLFELNFETLPSAPDRYWIEDATLAVAPSLTLLEQFARPEHNRLLLIGNPNFHSREFPPLKHVEAEMQTVSRHFPQREVFDAAAATPDAYRRADVADFSTVHFAAHAVANTENPLDSAIILSGAGDSHKLYARDVMRQRLNADLVTLSACQTAGNKTYGGEGLTGLAWAFLSAGARNVVAGLWDVDDRATSQMMGGFYDALAHGRTPAAALREAKLSLMRSSRVYRKPVYWAAFETFTRAVYDAAGAAARTAGSRRATDRTREVSSPPRKTATASVALRRR